MRASTAYFAGAGTVVVAILMGVGGGALMADIMNPQGKFEQRQAVPQHAQQSAQPSQGNAAANGSQTPVPYLAATQQAATAPVVVSPAPSGSPQPPNQASNASSPVASPAAVREQGAAPENAYAKAQDADVKHSADEKRKADRAERRQKRTTRRQQRREQEQRNAEAQMREDGEPGGNIIVRRDNPRRDDFRHGDSDRPMRMDFPRFNLFGQD